MTVRNSTREKITDTTNADEIRHTVYNEAAQGSMTAPLFRRMEQGRVFFGKL